MAQILTPSSKSAGLAGGVFWGMMWLALGHINHIAELFKLEKFIDSKHIFRWIDKHKGVALLCTEICNYGIHGIKETRGVTFAIGGTVCNVFAIYIVMPIMKLIRGNDWLYGGK